MDEPACHFHGKHLWVLMHWGWHSLGEFESSQTLSPGVGVMTLDGQH